MTWQTTTSNQRTILGLQYNAVKWITVPLADVPTSHKQNFGQKEHKTLGLISYIFV